MMQYYKSLHIFTVTGLVMLMLASCGGGGDGSSSTTATSQTINSIVVPSEPDAKLNNATIAGVDSNNNGVRDDVEREIANMSTGGKLNEAEVKIHKHYQMLLLKNNEISTENIRELNCLILRSEKLNDIYGLTINTQKRQDLLLQFDIEYSKKINRISRTSEELCVE